MKRLTINEQIFLIAIWYLDDEAYGVRIREKIAELTGSKMLFGTIYNTLEYLQRKGYVISRKGGPEEEKHASKKVYYKITKTGLKALEQARRLEPRTITDDPDSWPPVGERVIIKNEHGMFIEAMDKQNDFRIYTRYCPVTSFKQWSYLPEWSK